MHDEIERLKAENAKLRSMRDTWQENDAKLRELVRDMWRYRDALSYGVAIPTLKRMRELGIEVSDG